MIRIQLGKTKRSRVQDFIAGWRLDRVNADPDSWGKIGIPLPTLLYGFSSRLLFFAALLRSKKPNASSLVPSGSPPNYRIMLVLEGGASFRLCEILKNKNTGVLKAEANSVTFPRLKAEINKSLCLLTPFLFPVSTLGFPLPGTPTVINRPGVRLPKRMV